MFIYLSKNSCDFESITFVIINVCSHSSQSLRALWLARSDRDPFVSFTACAAWGELEHLRAWDTSGLGGGCLIQELP